MFRICRLGANRNPITVKSRKAEEPKVFGMAPKPERGNLIEISRHGYQHWALYVGKGDVIHLVKDSDHAKAGCWSSSGSPVGQDKGKVKREKLEDVVGKDKYRVNNLLDDHYGVRPFEDILKDTGRLEGKKLPYDVLKYNCEHFVTLLRYGTPLSLQVQQAEAAAVVFSALVVAAVAFGFIVTAKPIEKNKSKEKK